ncbi:MAG TPA: hypothetical protein PKV84_01095 [Candidatus Omnitrophota bacterium]|nr:hypothetical protein [Candidatus Omnitrophota bacterium]
MLKNDLDKLRKNIREIAAKARQIGAKQVVLSCEGIYTRFPNFSREAKEALREFEKHFTVTLWCIFREPVSFAMSLFSQPVKHAPCALSSCHGTSEPPEIVAEHPWFQERLNYKGFIQNIEGLFSSSVVLATQYEPGGTIEQARSLLGVDAAILCSAPDANVSLSALSVYLMRRLNRLTLKPKMHRKLVSIVKKMDKFLNKISPPLRASDAMKRKVQAVSQKSEEFLKKKFGICWDEGLKS